MPNGVDKNLVRLAIACASFRQQHDAWPTQARVAPIVMWEYGQLLDAENFERLCSRLRFRVTSHAHIAVGTSKAHLVYETTEHDVGPRLIDDAWNWLSVQIRSELEGLE
jgi:hypothetical protein